MSQDALKIGLIGTGRIGRLHAQHLRHRIDHAQLLMVSDICEESACQCAEQFEVEQVSTDYRKLLEHPEIRAVVICSSTDTHASMIEEAAQHGKQIFCEKPIDHDLQKIDRALLAVERAGVLLQIGFNRRFDASFSRVRAAVDNGEIGTPHLLHIISRDPSPPPTEYIKVSGGLFLDMTIHDFDMARYLLGREVEEIYATGAVLVDPAIGEAGDLDTAVIVLKFSDGVIGTIDNSRQAVYGYDQRVEVFGSGGSVQAGNRYPNEVAVLGRDSVSRDLPLNFFIERYQDSYLEEMRQFVNAVRAGAPSPMSGQEGRIPVVMGQAALKSYQENRPVRLDEIDPALIS
jgi:myo-inositol 2-dehydrogenase/D-chiro-inositol 1-dehydrogenase